MSIKLWLEWRLESDYVEIESEENDIKLVIKRDKDDKNNQLID